ncbi:unnamed protein product [Urochloa humidicola]
MEKDDAGLGGEPRSGGVGADERGHTVYDIDAGATVEPEKRDGVTGSWVAVGAQGELECGASGGPRSRTEAALDRKLSTARQRSPTSYALRRPDLLAGMVGSKPQARGRRGGGRREGGDGGGPAVKSSR